MIPDILRRDAGIAAARDEPIAPVRRGGNGVARRIAHLRGAAVRHGELNVCRRAAGDAQRILRRLAARGNADHRFGIRRRPDRASTGNGVILAVALGGKEDAVRYGGHGVFVRIRVKDGLDDLRRAVRRFHGNGPERRHAHDVYRVRLYLHIPVRARVASLERDGDAVHAVADAARHGRIVRIPGARDFRGVLPGIGIGVYRAQLGVLFIRHRAHFRFKIDLRRAVGNIEGLFVRAGELGAVYLRIES